jgi:ubiquinone/menaquinone biosynthesis C-methylase UbiE
MWWRRKKYGQTAISPPVERTPDALPTRQLFRWIRGRRYIEGSTYIGPKDATTDNMLDFQHFIVRRVLGGNHQSPLRQPRAILDAGCGTGRWVIEMAAEFPHASVIGLDIVPPASVAPLLTSLGPLASNVSFVAADLLQALPFADDSFDYVHQQLMYDDLPAHQWPSILGELVRVTRPGGWVECIEQGEAPYDAGPAYQRLTAWMAHLCRQRGVDPDMGPKLRHLLYSAGIEQPFERIIPAFPNSTPSRERRLWQAQALGVFETVFRDALLAAKAVSPENFDAVLAQTRVEFAQARYANSDVLYVAFGRKPLTSSPLRRYDTGAYRAFG